MSDITASAGETVIVEDRTQNTGDEQGTQDIILERDNTQEDSASSVTLDAGGLRRGYLSIDTSGLSSGDYQVRLSTDDDADTFTLTIS